MVLPHLVISYYKTLLPKMEEFFYVNQKIIYFFPEKSCRNDADAAAVEQSVHPKVPDRAQQVAEKAEKQHHAAESARKEIEVQLAVTHLQDKEKQETQRRKRVERIQHSGKDGAAVLPQRPKQVIDQPQRKPEDDGTQENAELERNIDFHAAQPSSRCSQPPRFSCSS